MDTGWIVALATPFVGAGVGFVVWYFQSRIDKIHKAEAKLRDERRGLYVEVLDPFVRMFAGLKSPQEAQKALKQITSYEYKKTAFEFTLIGSDNVVRAFNEMMQYFYRLEAGAAEVQDPRAMVHHWGAFLLAIRKDVGDPHTTLSEVDMLKSQLKDVQKYE